MSKGNIVFIESFCRVKSLSLTGRILYALGIVDLFLVHWPELLSLDGGVDVNVDMDVGGQNKNGSGGGGTDSVRRKSCGGKMVLIDSFIRHD